MKKSNKKTVKEKIIQIAVGVSGDIASLTSEGNIWVRKNDDTKWYLLPVPLSVKKLKK